ncbi:MAG: hypothetical protein QXT67_08535 [Candidatus Bathyarchaeia archaeon]
MDDVETILREMGAFKVGVANPLNCFEKRYFSSCPVGSFKKPLHVYKCKAFADLLKELKERLIAKF